MWPFKKREKPQDYNPIYEQKEMVEFCATNKIDCRLIQTENGIYTQETYNALHGIKDE